MERCCERSSLKDRQIRTSGRYQFTNRGALEDPYKSDLERYSEEDSSAVQHFLSGGEGVQDMVSQGRKALAEFDPEKNPNQAHEDVQGMLLELGKIYGYETSAAINDAKKKFIIS